jgi:hypothetical protein
MKDLGNARVQRVTSTYTCVLVYMYTVYVYVCVRLYVPRVTSTEPGAHQTSGAHQNPVRTRNQCTPAAVYVTRGSGDQSRPCAFTAQAGSVSTEH